MESLYAQYEKPKGSVSESHFVYSVDAIIRKSLERKFMLQNYSETDASSFASTLSELLRKSCSTLNKELGSERGISLDHAQDLQKKYPEEMSLLMWISDKVKNGTTYEFILEQVHKEGIEKFLSSFKTNGQALEMRATW